MRKAGLEPQNMLYQEVLRFRLVCSYVLRLHPGGRDDACIYASDPNKNAAPGKQLSSKFSKCMKQAFISWPA